MLLECVLVAFCALTGLARKSLAVNGADAGMLLPENMLAGSKKAGIKWTRKGL